MPGTRFGIALVKSLAQAFDDPSSHNELLGYGEYRPQYPARLDGFQTFHRSPLHETLLVRQTASTQFRGR